MGAKAEQCGCNVLPMAHMSFAQISLACSTGKEVEKW